MVKVCAASDLTCATPITVYSSSTGAAKANPFSTDTVGNYIFYAATGYYTVKETYQGFSYIYQISLADTAHTVASADQFPGADMGAQVNAAIASVGCGEVDIPAGNFSFTTAIVKPRCVLLKGKGANATTLTYAGTSAAIVVGDTSVTGTTTSFFGTEDLSLVGPGAGTSGSPASTIGVFLGGDPSAVISPANYFANGQTFYRVTIFGFGVGVKWGNNAYATDFITSVISVTNTAIYLPSGTSNSGENINFIACMINNGVSAVNGSAMRQDMSASDVHFIATSVDNNVSPDFKGSAWNAEFTNPHFEHDTVGEFFSINNGATKIDGGLMENIGASGSDPDFGTWSGSSGTELIINGLTLSAAHTMTRAFNFTATGTYAQIVIRGVPCYNGNGNIPLLTNSITLGRASYIEDCEANSGNGVTTIGNLFVAPSATITSITDGFVTWNAAQFNRVAANIEFQFAGSASEKVRVGGGGSHPIVFDANTGDVKAQSFSSNSNCAGVGTAASPSVASCGAATAGHFSCATNATGATCQVNTTAVTAASEIFVFESDTSATGTALGVTCNTSTNVLPASMILASQTASTGFVINLGTVTTNPACFSFHVIN